MIPRTRKKAEELESDSDWDSLPGDVPEPNSSPEPNGKATTTSISPIPPKQPNTHGKHTGLTKPMNLYKSSMKSSKGTGNATAFEDRSGGIWNEDDDRKLSFSKEDKSNNNKNDSKVLRERKERRDAHKQKSEKKPPFTDFHEALTTPVPPPQNSDSHYDEARVNQAYVADKEDIHETNHESWDESENETISQSPPTHEHKKGREVEWNRKNKADFQPPVLDLVQHHTYNGNPDTQFENCCFIQVSHGPHDDRNRPSFFHGSKDHFHIRKDDPRATITEIAEKSEVILQRFWREVFGVLIILVNFFLIFILEFFKVMVHSVQYLITGILYTLGDHFIKPLLSAFFNNFIQPFSILSLNFLTIFTNLLKPLLSLTREILSQVAIPLKAFRLFELNYKNKRNDSKCTDIEVV